MKLELQGRELDFSGAGDIMNSMKGSYVIKVDGVEIARSENLLTTSGKRIIASFMAGLTPRWAGAIAAGVSGTAATVLDSKLGFEFVRSPINSSAVNYNGGTGATHRLIFKATLDQSAAGKIYELGIFPNVTNIMAGVAQSQVISYGDSSEAWQEFVTGTGWTTITTSADSTNNRVGSDMVRLRALTATGRKYRLSGLALDLGGYSTNDLINFAFRNDTANPTSFNIQFNTDDSNYFTTSPTIGTFIGATGAYKTSTLTKSNFTAVGVPSWSNITSIEFQVINSGGSTCDFLLDSIRMEDVDTANPDYALVSRSVLGGPITKSAGSLMDIEYYLDVNS